MHFGPKTLKSTNLKSQTLLAFILLICFIIRTCGASFLVAGKHLLQQKRGPKIKTRVKYVTENIKTTTQK